VTAAMRLHCEVPFTIPATRLQGVGAMNAFEEKAHSAAAMAKVASQVSALANISPHDPAKREAEQRLDKMHRNTNRSRHPSDQASNRAETVAITGT
jgi:hypothetical protein